MSISKIKLADNTVYEIIPHKLTDSTYTVTLPTLTADSTFALSSDLSSYLPLTGGTLTGLLKVKAQDLTDSNKLITENKTGNFWSLNTNQYNSLRIAYNGNGTFELSAGSFYGIGGQKTLGTSSVKWKDLYLSGNLSDGTNSVTIAEIQSKISAGTNIEITNNTVSTTDNVLTDTDILYFDCGSATSNTSDSPDITVLLTTEY